MIFDRNSIIASAKLSRLIVIMAIATACLLMMLSVSLFAHHAMAKSDINQPYISKKNISTTDKASLFKSGDDYEQYSRQSPGKDHYLSQNSSLGIPEIDITEGNIRPFNIAIPNFSSDNTTIAVGLASVIGDDLHGSGGFKVLSSADYSDLSLAADRAPDYRVWQRIGAEGLLTGKVSIVNGSQIKVAFRLWDIVNKRQRVGEEFTTDVKHWRRIAHIIADTIYQSITGDKGYFDSLITFVSETGTRDARRKRITIMDQDGFNIRYLTSGDRLALTPRFDRDADKIAYVSYNNNVPQVRIIELKTGRNSLLGSYTGMTFAPRFAPDGRTMLMSLQKGDFAKLFDLDINSKKLRQITTGTGIDTSADYSPDGRQIVFESDRGGKHELYLINTDGSGLRKLSAGEGAYATPVWSPRGDLIAFTKRYNGRFQIGIMSVDGSGEKILTESYHNEGPSWGPNGKMLVFFRDTPGAGGGSQLWTVDINGGNERRLLTPAFASDPDWSNLLQ